MDMEIEGNGNDVSLSNKARRKRRLSSKFSLTVVSFQ
jgi:hypothetical protein